MTATGYLVDEYVILVDGQDQEIGLAEKLSAHENNLLHRAFSVFIFRQNRQFEFSQFELLLQQRALHKYHSPGLWTNTCCSHPRAGEDIIKAGKRRLNEELGIITPLKNIGWFHYHARFPNGLSENEIDHVLVGMVPLDTPITPHPDEVHAYRWITLSELQHELTSHPEQFTPWLAKALGVVQSKSVMFNLETIKNDIHLISILEINKHEY